MHGILAAAPGDVGPDDKPRWFSIPSEPLALALQNFSRQSGLQLLYESELAADQRSVRVEGRYTLDQALRLLLSRTHLTIHYTRRSAATLSQPGAARASTPASLADTPELTLAPLEIQGETASLGGRADLTDYTVAVESDVRAALHRDARTRSGHYRVGLRLWVDATRRVERAQLFQSSGDLERDAAIAAMLRGLTISRDTPAGLPQPIRVMIVVRSLQ